MESGSDRVRRFLAGVALASLIGGCTERAPEASASSAGHPGRSGERVFDASRLSMGSSLRVTIWGNDDARTKEAAEEVFREFDRLERLMSSWIAESDVSRANQAAGGHPIAASPEVREVIIAARQASEWTNGKFDITFGALSGLWKFDHDQNNVVPHPAEVRRRLPLIDYRAVQVDNAAGTIAIARAGASIHLGGIGKGYAIDRAAAIVRNLGFGDFMIQSGGDIYVGGLNGGAPWRIGIQDPRGAPDQRFAELELSNAAVSTSGDYERFFVKDGRRYHHLLDPETGEPARGARSVTIVSNRSVVSDALATGVFVMEPTEGLALVERLPDVEAAIVTDRNEVLISSGLRRTLRFAAPPTP